MRPILTDLLLFTVGGLLLTLVLSIYAILWTLDVSEMLKEGRP